MNKVFFQKIVRIIMRKLDAWVGRFYSLDKTLSGMGCRPFELHLEFTNLCNAKCIFCPYQFQQREVQFMTDEVFEKAVSDYCKIGGGSVGLTPIVGDALIDPQFLERVKYLRRQPKIDRIFLTTNAILLDKFGVKEVLESGISAMTISTSGFDEISYERIYKSKSYSRMKKNVFDLLKCNSERENPIPITIGIRTDRSLKHVMKDLDMQPMLKFKPMIDFTWSYTTANGRIKREALPKTMKLRGPVIKKEPCVQSYNGLIVISDGSVLICSCVAAVDGEKDLKIGHILSESLFDIWVSSKAKEFREKFGKETLNSTCQKCDMYRDLGLYRTKEGRERARVNRLRFQGENIKRQYNKVAPFMGG